MDIFVEKHPHCLATLRSTVPAERVDAVLRGLATEYQKLAKLPGYRPGKAPLPIVQRRYAAEIAAEAAERLVREVLTQAAKEQKLVILDLQRATGGDPVAGKDWDLNATLTLEPEFQLPDIAAAGLTVEGLETAEEDVERALRGLFSRLADYPEIEGRPLQMGDYAVLDFTAEVDGTPLGELVPETPESLRGGTGRWVHMEQEAIWPGFCAGLVGAAKGETRQVEVAVPADVAIPSLQGKTIRHTVTVQGIREQRLPEINDETARQLGAPDLEAIRNNVRQRLEEAKVQALESRKRTAVLHWLVENARFEVPAALVQSQTRRVLREIVEEEQSRGATNEEIESRRESLIQSAVGGAEGRTRIDFLLIRTVKDHQIEVTQEELVNHLSGLAQRLEMPLEKLVKQVARRRAFDQLRLDVAKDKALDFLASKVTVLPPAAAAS